MVVAVHMYHNIYTHIFYENTKTSLDLEKLWLLQFKQGRNIIKFVCTDAKKHMKDLQQCKADCFIFSFNFRKFSSLLLSVPFVCSFSRKSLHICSSTYVP